MRQAIATFATRAAEKLRKQNSTTTQMQVFIRTNKHREDRPQHNDSRFVTFVTPTDSTLEIVNVCINTVGFAVHAGAMGTKGRCCAVWYS